MQSNSPRVNNMRELRRAAASNNGASRDPSESMRSALDLDRDAKAASDRLKDALRKIPPWAKEVEVHRQRCRDLFLSLLFGHPLSTHAQSLEPLWHHTTYSLISAYRGVTANLEAALSPPSGNRKRPNGNNRREQDELKKVLTRFRQVLISEDLFYRSLITRLVGFYQLQPLTAGYLSAVSIAVPEQVVNGGPEQGLAPMMSFEEKKDKVGLVYKALICLGDLERYRVQYDDNTRRQVREGRPDTGKSASDKFGKAWMYYEVARALVPDDGSAFNQLAVVSTYGQDEFLCVYYYFRALAVKSSFKNINEILEKFLRKVYERWAGRIQQGEEVDEGIRSDLLVLVAILYRRNGLSMIDKVEHRFSDALHEQIEARQLPSEIIVKMTAMIIGAHWHARQTANVTPTGTADPRAAQRRLETEIIALRVLLDSYTQVLAAGATQVEEALRVRASESAIDDDEPKLHLHISAVLRRILPALRIYSKWLKLHLEYITRIQRSGVLGEGIATFWENYTRLAIALATLFPIDHLPILSQPLEEDIDMRGYIPLAWGMFKGTGDGEQHDSHPNEEQLMRIADLQVDAKLLAQLSSGQNASTPSVTYASLPGMHTFGTRDPHDDLASVSTETEDDPVNMAMNASLGGSSIDEDELRDGGEEVIVWNATPGLPNTTQHSFPPQSPFQPPIVQDLLQNLVIDNTHSPSRAHTPPTMPALPRHSSAGQQSPGMLFGGDATGSSIWTMTREESGRGTQRGAVTPNVNIANIWGNSDQTPSPPTLTRQSSSQPGWQRATGSGTWGKEGGLGGLGVIGGPSGANGGWNGQRKGGSGPAMGQYPR